MKILWSLLHRATIIIPNLTLAHLERCDRRNDETRDSDQRT